MNTQNIKVSELKPAAYNPRVMSKIQMEKLKQSIKSFGYKQPIIWNKRTGNIVGGHQRLTAMKEMGLKNSDTVEVEVVDWDIKKEKAANLAFNRIDGQWDDEMLAETLRELDTELLQATGFEDDELTKILDSIVISIEPEDEHIPKTPEIPEAKRGDIYQLGSHRLMCGDSTNVDDVEQLMDGETASLLHADPPYGMGKENDGVMNDNLYKDKLDTFQMAWWHAFRPYLSQSAGAYIWGNAEDLWRLWYAGGLNDSEPLTMRNEIVWNKKNGQGILSETYRMFPIITERCLYFVLGEHGFNTNSNNYWTGWDPVRKYLADEKAASGISNQKLKELTASTHTHYWTTSQWEFPPKKHYEAIREYCMEEALDAFHKPYKELKAEYEDLRRKYVAQQAHFNNTHEKMADVWEYDRVSGDERHEHATPKPVEMMMRVMKTSSKKGEVVVEPFGGSGSTLIAAENTGRHCYMMEMSEKYVDVIIKRWEEKTGKKAKKLN